MSARAGTGVPTRAAFVAASFLACSALAAGIAASPPFPRAPAGEAKAGYYCLVVPMIERGGGNLEPAGAPGPGALFGDSPASLVTQLSTLTVAGGTARYALVMSAPAFGSAPQAAWIYEPVLAERDFDLVALRFVRAASDSSVAAKPAGAGAAKLSNLSKGMEARLVPVSASSAGIPVPVKLALAPADPKAVARVECLASWPGGGGILVDATGRTLGIAGAKTAKGDKGFQIDIRSVEGALAIAERVRSDAGLVALSGSSGTNPKVVSVAFCSELKNDGTAKDPGTLFDPARLREIVALVEYADFDKGMQVREVWTYEGKTAVDRVYPWTGSRTGYVPLRWDNGGKTFGSGKYQFLLYLDGARKASGEFTVAPMSVFAGIPIRVKGRVIDADTRSGIDSVTIGVLQPGLSLASWSFDETKLATMVITDFDGSFEFPDKLPRGNSFSVFVTAYGYLSINADYGLRIPADQTDPMVITITLKRAR